MKLFNHVQIKVTSLKRSKDFYDSIMSILGYSIVLSIKDTVIGYGTSVHDMFEIRQESSKSVLSKSIHIAFNAPDRQSVDNFYLNALEKGGHCNGKPGLRTEYEEGYYAAFVVDPDGHNIEVVHCKA
jgi:predicted lactoylglutathione lyase